MQDLKYWLLLQSIEGIGPVTYRNLLEKFADPKSVFEANLSAFQSIPRLSQKITDQIFQAEKEINNINTILEQLRNRNIQVITIKENTYPNIIKKLSNFPPILYLSKSIPKGKTIGIIGTRDASQYGIEQAYKFAKDLANDGFIIVSGYAKGIDTAAHWGAVATNQETIAVLPTGILKFQLHQELSEVADNFYNNAAIISEFFPLSEWSIGNALLRNRITAALSDYIMVIESGESGGTLNTVEHSIQLGKKAFIYKDIQCPTDEKIISLGAIPISNITELINELDT
jgi:DNA processing protein